MAQNASHIMAALASIACICLFPVLSASAEDTVNADAAAEQTGWIREDGRITYRFADGHTASGETEIDGVYYLFSYSGTLKTDWQTVDGKRCYFDPATGEAVFGWVDYFGCLYYVTKEQGKLTGTQEIEGVTYTFDADGALQETILTEVTTEAASEAAQTAATEAPAPETAAPEETPLPANTEAVVTALAEILPFVPDQIAVPLESCLPEVSEADAAAVEALIEEAEPVAVLPVAETAASPLETLAPVIECTEAVTTAAEPVIEVLTETVPVTEPLMSIPDEATVADDTPALTSTKAALELAVPDYLQKDPAWVNASLGGETIGKYGCLVTAMAMLHSYTAGTCTPVDMTAKLAFTKDGSLQKWDDITALGYTVESYSTPVTAEILDAIYQHLRDGKPVVLGSVGKWQHYVVVTGYTGDGGELTAADFLIHDPGYPDRRVLADHLAAFGTLYKLIYAS